MPEAMFLQIHGGGSPTMRMLELPAGPIRIGRGAHCEVRLVEAELAEVQCILRLRGTTWHYQPVGPSGRVWIDGRAAEEPRTVAQGVPFRVGDHWLTLRSAQNAFHDWVAFDDPVPIVPDGSKADGSATSEPSEATTLAHRPQRPQAGTTPDENEERLLRWQARLEQRERMLKDRQDERRWEARWKSAGESIRARSGSSPRSSPTPGPTPPPSSVTPARPVQAPAPAATSRPLQTPPVSRIIERRPTEPIRRVVDPSLGNATPRPSVRPSLEPSTVHRRPVETPAVRIPIKPTFRVLAPSPTSITPEVVPEPPVSRALVLLANEEPIGQSLATEGPTPTLLAPVEVEPPSPIAQVVTETETETETEAEADPIVVLESVDEIEVRNAAFEALEIDEILAQRATMTEDSTIFVEPRVLDAPESFEKDELTESLEPIDVESLDSRAIEVEAPVLTGRVEPSAWVDELSDDDDQDSDHRESQVVVPIPVERPRDPEPEIPAGLWTDPSPVEPVAPISSIKSDYPSARAIFAAQGRRPQPAPVASISSRKRFTEPIPTECQAPAQWSMPLWLGWLPTLAASLICGGVSVMLAFEWLVEAGGANTGLKLAVRPDTSASPLIDPSLIPKGGWWSSNAPHLAAWAVALERSNDGEDHSEEVRSLMTAARDASPLGARAFFNVEATAGAPIDPTDASEIGRTRDLVSLIGTGRRLREAGKLESALRAYRSAFEIAATARREGLDPPLFDEGNQVRRYALPHESLIGLVARDMAERGTWTTQQWASALPASPLTSWVTSKVLNRLEKKAEADLLADQALRQADNPPPTGFDPAEHRAAAAEALAYRGRWTDAVEQYRLAIDQASDDATRRSWWLNLAELARRMSDDPAQARAIEAAKSLDLVDEITQRARKFQETLPGLVAPGSRR